jgi:hypothetical protein
MIIRTYQRRQRSGPGRSLSDGNLVGDGVGSSGSQNSVWGSSQDPAPFSFPSSQDSCWSQSDSGNSTSRPKSNRLKSYDDDFGDETPSAQLRSRPPLARSYSDRPPLSVTKKNGDGALSRAGKLKPSNGITWTNPNRGELDRRNSKDGQDFGGGSTRLKKSSSWADGANDASLWVTSAPTSTLMEAQESGEIMEHVDEANFALDGLREGQPVRIQRASLTSLLSLCCSMQRRRMLRTHG